MIWFACKQCGKSHGRGEHLAGTLVFCECGHGNRVPWSSTIAEPEPEEAIPAPAPRPRSPLPPRAESRSPSPFPPYGGEKGEWPRRSRERRRPNPAYCLNHDETAKEAACDACRCSFCSACVLTLQGQTLCGPCKNFRLGGLNRPARLSPVALVSFVLALICTPVGVFLGFMAIGSSLKIEAGLVPALICCAIALIFAVGELVLSAFALRELDRQPALGGRGLAMSGAMAGLTGVVWSFTLAVFIVLRQVQG
ncbi:MAG: hypothetical protein ACYC3I_05790 [Gemmataceae bacterium]